MSWKRLPISFFYGGITWELNFNDKDKVQKLEWKEDDFSGKCDKDSKENKNEDKSNTDIINIIDIKKCELDKKGKAIVFDANVNISRNNAVCITILSDGSHQIFTYAGVVKIDHEYGLRNIYDMTM